MSDAASVGLIPLYKIPSPGKQRGSALTFPKDETVQFTREWFARVMVDPKLYSAFVDYVELEHCSENIQFYQELTQLEDLVASSVLASSIQEAASYESARSAGSTQSLARFLRAAATAMASSSTQSTDHLDSTTNPPTLLNPASSILITLPPLPASPAPSALRQRYLEMFQTFIAAGSSLEINVTDATRKRIAAALVSITTPHSTSSSMQPNEDDPATFPSTVFDAAGDEIIDLLYRDTFKRFVTFRAKQHSHPTTGTDGSSTPSSSTRGSHDAKRNTGRLTDDDFEDPLGDITPDMAMLLLAQAAIQAEEQRERREASSSSSSSLATSGTSTPKKKGFWRWRKDGTTTSTAAAADKSASSLRHAVDSTSSSQGMPSPSTSRRSSTSSQNSADPDSSSSSSSTFTKPTNAPRTRKMSIFAPSQRQVTDISPAPPPLPIDTSPKRLHPPLAPLDVSGSLARPTADHDATVAGPKSAGATPGWGFRVKTPVGEKTPGGWFGRRTTERREEGEDVPPVPEVPDHLRKGVAKG
ncbi:hypothetical protein HDU67_001104 [Dinochytrium kinnereticum]|nr:hypothetical protein HDU67_001104 [Dinochytrium kinnereticum]